MKSKTLKNLLLACLFISSIAKLMCSTTTSNKWRWLSKLVCIYYICDSVVPTGSAGVMTEGAYSTYLRIIGVRVELIVLLCFSLSPFLRSCVGMHTTLWVSTQERGNQLLPCFAQQSGSGFLKSHRHKLLSHFGKGALTNLTKYCPFQGVWRQESSVIPLK
jgi:hypothetical protein